MNVNISIRLDKFNIRNAAFLVLPGEPFANVNPFFAFAVCDRVVCPTEYRSYGRELLDSDERGHAEAGFGNVPAVSGEPASERNSVDKNACVQIVTVECKLTCLIRDFYGGFEFDFAGKLG